MTSAFPIAVVVANGVLLLATAVVPGEAFLEWGWRAPFLLGSVILLLAWYIHRTVTETPEFTKAAATIDAQRIPLARVVRDHWATVLLAAVSYLVGIAYSSIQATGILDYATRVLHLPRQSVLGVVLLGSVVFVPLIPAFAALSDRIGRFAGLRDRRDRDRVVGCALLPARRHRQPGADRSRRRGPVRAHRPAGRPAGCAVRATNLCVESTVRSAVVRDYPVTVLEDCCASFTARLHAISIEVMRDCRFAEITAITAITAGSAFHPGVGACP